MKHSYLTLIAIILKTFPTVTLYSCHYDQCVFHTEYDIIKYHQIPNSTHILIYKLPIHNLNYSQYTDTKLKQIETKQTIAFRGCTNKTQFFEYFKSNYKPITEKMLKRTKGSRFQLGKSNRLPFETCLFSKCVFQVKQDPHVFTCFHDDIYNLSINFVDRYCASAITYAHIQSQNLKLIGNESAFFKNRFRWNIVYLKLEMSKNDSIHIECNAFKYLKQLRVLEINLNENYLHQFRCIFKYNPNLIKVISPNSRIWNLCNDQNEEIKFDNLRFFDLYLLLVVLFITALSIMLILVLRLKKAF